MKLKPLFSLVFIAGIILPQLAYSQEGRQVKSLDENWQFYKGEITKTTDTAALAWTGVDIPHSWNAVDMQRDTVYYQGNAWYKKSIFIPESYKGKRLFLKFGAVGNVADVYVNRAYIGKHKGGYSAFTFEITDAVQLGKNNVIMVKANNEMRPDVIPINQRLFANYGGMYRHVNLIATSPLNITTLDYASSGVYVDQKMVSEEKAEILTRVKLENKWLQQKNVDIKVRLLEADGTLKTAKTIRQQVAPQGVTTARIPLQVNQPHLWNARKDPYLYTLQVQVYLKGNLIDEVTETIGLRSFHIEPGKGFFLNGEPYRLYGVSRHQDRWGYGNALTDEMQRQDIEMIADIGATSARFGHYQQADIVYEMCDSLGILAWAEIPFVNNWSGEEGPNAKQQLKELIKQNYNHPSIFTWGLHNEVYTKSPTGYPARLTHQLNEIAKTLDPYRPSISTNGYGTMERPMNRMADIQAMNRYYGWYEGKMEDLKDWVEGLEKNYPDFKVMLSEYGAGGNIHQHVEEVKKPKNVVSGTFFPEEYQTALHVQHWAVIEQHPYLAASYVWNMFDFCVPGGWTRGGVINRNLKGLVTFDRKIKKDAFYWYKANWSPSPVLHITDRRDTVHSKAQQRIEVFSNIGRPKLWVNGKRQPKPEQGANAVDWIWSDVELQPGENTLKVERKAEGETYTDVIKTTYRPE